MKMMNNFTIETLMNMYYEEDFSHYQLREIEEGLLNGLDVSVYTHRYFLSDQMKLIRKGLEKGYDVSTYAVRDYSRVANASNSFRLRARS